MQIRGEVLYNKKQGGIPETGLYPGNTTLLDFLVKTYFWSTIFLLIFFPSTDAETI